MDENRDPTPRWTLPEALQELESAGCGDTVLELVRDFQTDTAQRLQRLRQALASSDAATFRREAHSIKGSAAQMGADEVAALARVLEIEGASMPAWAVQASVDKLQTQFELICRQMAAYADSKS
jgi:HPt (histidine-containing phosphotransfer) domain-containing protein